MFILGKIIFFSEGLLFIHSQYGSITLSKDHISNVKFYDPVIFIDTLQLKDSSFVCFLQNLAKYYQNVFDLIVLLLTRTPALWLLFSWSMRAVCSPISRSLSTAQTSVWSLLFSPGQRATGPSIPRYDLCKGFRLNMHTDHLSIADSFIMPIKH